MKNSNEEIVNRFFEAYGQHDFKSINEVMAENVEWFFLGDHPLAGIKKGMMEVVAFFDTMAGIMMKSKPQIDKLIVASSGNYFIECQHIRTDRDDGNNIDHYVSVLWTIENGKIVRGRHFFSDPPAVDHYFTQVVEEDNVHQQK
jgi:ketosteroid isomerase-like protein